MDNLYQLVVRKGPKPGQLFPLYAITTTIGREPISDIAINDPEVSRQHARLTQTDDSYQIEDLESTNGTFVNGVQIGTDPVQLAHGNEIQLGSGVTMLFELTTGVVEDEMGLETAVPVSPPSQLSPDPMMPPDFDRLSIIDPLPVTNSLESPLDVQNEREESVFEEYSPAISENIPPPPPEIPQVIVPPSLDMPPPPAEDSNPARRLFAIGATLIFLMMCCCCGFLFIMYQWGGDWLLQQMGLIP